MFKLDIDAIGFDLDQTLYKKNEEMDNQLREIIAKKIVGERNLNEDYHKIKELCEKAYLIKGSWTSVLREWNIENPKEFMLHCFEQLDISSFIQRDPELIKLFERIKRRYYTFMITASPKKQTESKLEKIGIEMGLFDNIIFGDDFGFTSKTDGSPFLKFLSSSPYSPEKHAYVGDSYQADILPAKKARMKTIAVWKNIPQADFNIETIYDLEKILF